MIAHEHTHTRTRARAHLQTLSCLKTHLCIRLNIFSNTFSHTFINLEKSTYSLILLIQVGYDIRSIFERSFTGLNSEFTFSEPSYQTKAKEPNLSYDLPIAEERTVGCIPITKVLAVYDMQAASTRIWTRVSMSISQDGNHWNMNVSTNALENLYLCIPIYQPLCSGRIWHKVKF